MAESSLRDLPPTARTTDAAAPVVTLTGAEELGFHVMTQPFWPELQRLIGPAEWQQFPRNADMRLSSPPLCRLWAVV